MLTLGTVAALTTMYACTDDPAGVAAPPDASFAHAPGVDLHADPGATTLTVAVNQALWQYPVPLNVGTGGINPFLSIQNTGIETGFNSEAMPLDTKRPQFTDSLPLNYVPVIVEPGQGTTLWREFILDANESDNAPEPQFAIRRFDLWMCDDPNAPNFDDITDFTGAPAGTCARVYSLEGGTNAGSVLRATTEFTSGSGQTLDYRILVPNNLFTAALTSIGQGIASCPYTGTSSAPCGTWLILHTTMGASPATGIEADWITDATFEEYSTVERPVQLLTLVKTIINDNGGTAVVSNFNLSTSAGVVQFGSPVVNGTTSTNTSTAISVPAGGGTFTLGETTLSGYTASAWACTGADAFNGGTAGSGTGSVTIGEGDTVVCSIVNNDVPARLTLVKVVTNNNGGTKTISDFPLTAGSVIVGQISGSAGATNVAVNAGSYALSEQTQAGYTASNWSCSGGTQTGASIALAVAQSATCTISNDDIGARLTLVKVVTNNNGGTKTISDFPLTAGAVIVGQISGSGGATNVSVNAGTYALSEQTQAGYTASTWNCSGGTQTGANIALALAQSATCTISNDDITARLTLVKVVTNNNGGTKTISDFALTADGAATDISGQISGSAGATNVAVNAGSYALSEQTQAGYTASTWNCSGGTQTGANIALALAQSATCTISNDDNAANLTLVKVVTNNNGGTKTISDFPLTAGGVIVGQISGSAGATNVGVAAGSYALSEQTQAGYTASTWNCTGGTQTGANIALALAQSATCTISNDDIGARLTLVKVVTNNNGGTKTISDFPLTAGAVIVGQISGSGGATNVAVNAGSYALSEQTQAGYTASTWNCSGGTQTGANIALALAQSATCTISNDDIGARLTLVKVVTNNNGGTKTISDFPLTAGAVIVSQISGSAGATNVAVNAGSYALSEQTQAGYTASTWNCSGGTQTGANIALALAQSATCTISNDDNFSHLTLVKVVTNNNGGTKTISNFPLTAGTVIVGQISGSTGATNVTVSAGTYALSEQTQAGYTASGWVCTGNPTSSTSSSVTMGLSQSATCTITNDDIAVATETAWAADFNQPGVYRFNPTGGNWATFVRLTDGSGPDGTNGLVSNFYAGQTQLAGTVTFSKSAGACMNITVQLNGWTFAPGTSVKVEDYASSPVGQSSAPGQFSYTLNMIDSDTASGCVGNKNLAYWAVHGVVID